jgi:PIN domain nuclease of toxin-antitoxin system
MTSLLLDTHTLIWFFQDDPRLGPLARAMIEDPTNRKLVSIATCWEIAIKVGIGKLILGEPTRPYLDRAIAQSHFELLPISLDHSTRVEGLAQHHKDPFDRLLIAQAIVEGVPIISVDPAFDPYPVRRIW